MKEIPPAVVNIVVAWSDLSGEDPHHLTTWIGEVERARIKIVGMIGVQPMITEAYVYEPGEEDEAKEGYYNVLLGINYERLGGFKDLKDFLQEHDKS